MVFSLASLEHWTIATGLVAELPWSYAAIWGDGHGAVLGFLVLFKVRQASRPGAHAPGARAANMVWAGVGWGIMTLIVCLSLVCWRAQSLAPLTMIPSVVMILYGLGWSIAAVVSRQPPGDQSRAVGAAVVGDRHERAERERLVEVAPEGGDARLQALRLVVDRDHDLDLRRRRAGAGRRARAIGAVSRPGSLRTGRQGPSRRFHPIPPRVTSDAGEPRRSASSLKATDGGPLRTWAKWTRLGAGRVPTAPTVPPRHRAPRRDAGTILVVTDMLTLAAPLPEVTFDPGDVVIDEGGEAGGLWVLLSGRLEVCKGSTRVNTIEKPGAIVGEVSLLLGARHGATIKALEPTRARYAADGHAFLLGDPEVTRNIAVGLAERLNYVTAYLADLKNQYGDAPGLSMVDTVLSRLAQHQDAPARSGSARDPDPEY